MSARGVSPRSGKNVALNILVCLALAYLLAPPAWMMISSFSPDAELLVQPPHWVPHEPTLRHYATLLQLPGADQKALLDNPQIQAFPLSFANSVVIALVTMMVCIALGSLSAYTLTRFVRPRLRKWLLLGLLASRMIPIPAVIIPIYFAFQALGLLNTIVGLIIVYTGLILPFVIWILEGYYRSFPKELEEAAALDGCRPLGVFVRIVLPLSRNGLFAAGIFAFISVWSDFIIGLTLTSTPNAWPLSVAVAQALNPLNEPSWGLMNAAGLLAASVPAVLAYLARGALMRGMLSGAVKG